MTKQTNDLAWSNLLYGLTNRAVIFLFLVVLIFFLPRLMPGDPIYVLFPGDSARDLSVAEIFALRERMGLTGSMWQQFCHYLATLSRGDLGYSVHHAASVAELLLTSLPWTAFLVLLSLPIFLLAGIGLGIEAGRVPHSRFDRVLTSVIAFFACVPPFVFAVLLLVLFSFVLPLFPLGGAEPIFPAEDPFARIIERLHHAFLPALALAMHEVIRLFFITRGEALKLSSRNFIANARARGISGWRERLNYYGRNIMPIIIARLSDTVSIMVSTILFVEIVFAYPGVGHLIYNAILERDFVLMQGAILGLSAIILLLNWVIDLSSSMLARRG